MTFDAILESDNSLHFGHDRPGVRIPLGDTLAALNVLAILDLETRAVLDAVHGAFGAVRIGYRNDEVASHDDLIAVRIADDVLVFDPDSTLEVRLDEGLLRDLRRAADMERAHGELGARLTDRLCRNDADGLAHIDRRAAGKIASIALAAHPAGRLTGEHRADLDLLHPGGDEPVDVRFLEQRAVRNQHLVVRWVAHILRRSSAENTARQRRNYLPGVDDSADLDTTRGAAILEGDDAILRHVDQTPGQIPRIRRFQRGVGQPFARAVRRVEILEHGEPFLEVRDDRAFDNLTGRLRHQTTHTGELPHLRRRTAGARMCHHVDRVDLSFGALLCRRLRGRNFLHHRFRDLLGALRPGIDDLVVLFTLGDQAVVVLLLEVLNLLARLLNDFFLGVRHHHVVLAERNAGLEGVVEAERHNAVAEDYRLLLAAVAIDRIDHRGNFALRHQLVDEVERNLPVPGQYFAQ